MAQKGFLKIFRDQTQKHEAELRVKELEESVATVLREGEMAEAFFARGHPDDVERTAEEDRCTSEAGSYLDVTFRVVHGDGRVRWLNAVSDVARRSGPDGAAADPHAPLPSGGHVRSGVIIDVTERRREERMRTAVLEVGDGLRELDDPDEMARLAAKVMGQTLDLSRAGFGELDPDGDTFDIGADWTSRGAESIVGTLRLSGYGAFADDLRSGQTVVMTDARTDPRVPDPRPLEAASARASVNAPLMEGDGSRPRSSSTTTVLGIGRSPSSTSFAGCSTAPTRPSSASVPSRSGNL